MVINNLQVCDGTSSNCLLVNIKDKLLGLKLEAAESSNMILIELQTEENCVEKLWEKKDCFYWSLIPVTAVWKPTEHHL